MVNLDTVDFKCSVSSVLNRDVKQYGKKFLFDKKEDTCWNSDQGSPQWITLQFEVPQSVTAFHFQFQGGFAGKDSSVRIYDIGGNCILEESFYPEDVNSKQCFKLKSTASNASKIKFLFNSSTDFFGRIIVYGLEIL